MVTETTFKADVNGLLTKAKRDARIAVTHKLSEATLQNALHNSRVAFTILDAIEAEGHQLITALMAPYRGATNNGVRPSVAKAILRDALESYLMDSKGWGRSSPAFSDGRNMLLDRDHGPMAERLRDQLELDARLIDSEPKKNWWERHPIALGLGAVGALASVIGLLLKVLSGR